jgi:hypothetical protein
MLKSIAHPSGYIFVSTTGRPYTSHDLAQIVARLVKRAGITGAKLGAHTFRHTSLTLAAKATKSLLIVKALAQHDKAATSEIYIHLADEETQQEVSPLKLTEEFIHAKKPENSSQLALTAPDAQTEVITSQPTDDLSERMFPSIPAGKTARPALSFDDLTLMRTVFKFYVDKAPMNGNASKLVTLISRCVERPNKRGQPQ